MTVDGEKPKISIDRPFNITMPSDEDRDLIAVNKYQLKYIQNMLRRSTNKTDNLAAVIYFLLGCGVTCGLTAVSLTTASNLPIYMMPSVICASVGFFVVGGTLWIFMNSRKRQEDDDHDELDKEISTILSLG
ncbi:MAG TPA: hypothetical protein VMW30_07040 [Candidatus Paceibacterota bacterium]|nr:hypothetical protein [Candidatus Paceibacterota bacterium]